MANKPINWDDYEHGRSSLRQGSVGSNTSRVHFDESILSGNRPDVPRGTGDQGSPDSNLRRRRSSISMRINSLAHVGGVNSIESFARSWQRAVGFHEITPVRASFVVADEDVEQLEADGDVESALASPVRQMSPTEHRSLLRQQIDAQAISPGSAVHDDSDIEDDINDPIDADHVFENAPLLVGSPSYGRHDIFSHASRLSSPFGSSFGGTYGSLSSPLNESSRRHAAQLYEEQQAAGRQEPDKELEPLLVKRVEQEDGKIILAVVGQSTIYQTVLNSTNVLIGVGLLSLPLGIRYAGWIIGISFLTLAAITTGYTARLLGKCLDIDRSLITFADIAYIAFGPRAQIVIGILFTLELVAACVALFVLFADSLNLLLEGWGVLEFKILLGIIMVPLSFVPLRLLGYTSTLGIACCFAIVGLVFADGFIKPHTPGSLREPAATYLFPMNWSTLPLSFGLLMSPWGGHAVFPNIYRDMRHPKKYGKSLKYTFGFTYMLDTSMAVAGILMFGDGTRDMLTSNIFLTEGYPRVISLLMIVCIAIIPVTKLPLNARPIFSTIEHFFGLGPREIPESPALVGLSGLSRGLLICAIRIVVTVTIMIIAILCPSFDRVMALMGSAFCFTICVILPVAFYLKLFGKDISVRESILGWVLIVVCSIMALVGTVWAFLPKEITGGS